MGGQKGVDGGKAERAAGGPDAASTQYMPGWNATVDLTTHITNRY